MKKPILVIMAAGLGSRYGGLKQIDPIDDQGHIIVDYSIYDAIRAGFGKVVFIVKPELEATFREVIGDRISRHVEVEYAHQTLDVLPDGFSVPEGRTKPWGTAHAVLCAKDKIDAPFAAINADDFYGRSAFEAIAGFLKKPLADNCHAMVGYQVENTLTEHGFVARGVCSVDENQHLTGIVERTRIRICDGGAEYTEDDEHFTFIPAGTIVSMNMWGFQQSMLTEIENRFSAYLTENLSKNPLKCEYFLPLIPNQLIQEGKASVEVLPTKEKWYGVTYHDDKQQVHDAIAAMQASGIYPRMLWNK